MTLNSSGLSVGGTFVSASDKRLKFNDKPLTNALGVINQLEPVEYDQTNDLVDQYTSDTPQSRQCGFIAQSVQSIDELKTRSSRRSSWRRRQGVHQGSQRPRTQICTYAVKHNTGVEPNIEGATGANKRTTTIDQNHLLTISANIFVVVDAELV
ncbi:MAG: tail fiber domain-containing protein, partial [Candidatus Fonsibacter sp.]